MDPLQEQYIAGTLMPKADDIAAMEFTPFEGERVAKLTELQRNALSGYGQFATTPEERQERLMAAQDRLSPMLNRRFAQQGIGTEADAIRANAFGDRRDVYEGARQAELDALSYDLASREVANEDAGIVTSIRSSNDGWRNRKSFNSGGSRRRICTVLSSSAIPFNSV